MKLSELKHILTTIENITFELENGIIVPPYAHVTEVGTITREFIDCGGTIQQHKKVNIQLWTSTDYDHRLAPEKLINIIEISEKNIQIEDLEVEIEYQQDTIGKYNLDFNGKSFVLTSTLTDCLAPDACGVPEEKTKVKLSEIQNESSCCDPSSGCC